MKVRNKHVKYISPIKKLITRKTQKAIFGNENDIAQEKYFDNAL